MSSLSSITDTSIKAVKETEKYVCKSEAYYKLKIFQQLTYTLSAFVKFLVIGSMLFTIFVFLIIACTIMLSDFLGSIVYGCLVIMLCLGVITFILFLNRKYIDSVIIKKVSKSYFN